MLTPKMHKIADDIGEIIISSYEEEYLGVLFSCGLTIEDVIFQVLVVCCRYAYLVNAEKHPLSFYIEQEGLEMDLARKKHQRIKEYVQKKDKMLNESLQDSLGDTFRSPEFDLVRKKNRFPEYEFSVFQYWESNNIHDMELVKSIVERRITTSKKVKDERFRAIAADYDYAVENMKANYGKGPECTVFSSIQFFTLQTKYAFDFLYEIAVRMEELKIKEFPDMHDRLMAVAGSYKCTSSLPDLCPGAAADCDRKIEYPLIIQRQHLVNKIVSDPEGGDIDLILGTFIEASVLANAVRSHMHIGGLRLPLCVAQETKIEDWASVFEMYNVFRMFVPHKEWTDNRIKAVRKMYDLVSIDYKAL